MAERISARAEDAQSDPSTSMLWCTKTTFLGLEDIVGVVHLHVHAPLVHGLPLAILPLRPSWFGVEGSGFMVEGLGSRVWGLGFRVQG